MRNGFLFACAALGSWSCHSGATSYIIQDASLRSTPEATAPVRDAQAGDTIVNARFHNVRFHVWPGVALDLVDLRGRMHSTRADHVVSFDDKLSFVLAIDTGTVGLTATELSRLMNTYVFAYRDAPLRGLEFSIDGSHLVQRGILHKIVDIPFEMVGDVSVTPLGEMRVHPVSMKICTIPGLGLMKAVNVTLAKLLDLHEAKGVRVEGNDLLIDPAKVIPPPVISGHLVHVALEHGSLVQYFGGPTHRLATPAVEPDSTAPNYMMFRGGTLQFGRLFMVHADMQVIDLAPDDPFDFDIGRYHEQLVAGFHRTLPTDGLLVFMPDLEKISPRTVAKKPD